MASVRRLHESKGRRATGLIVVEGADGLTAALATQASLREVFVTHDAATGIAPLLEQAQASGAMVFEVTDAVMEALSQTRTPQGVVATCAWAPAPLTGSMRPGSSCVVLEAIGDPGNAGTIIRTADAAGLGGVVLTEGSVDPGNGKCVRASAGSVFHLPISAGVRSEAVLARASELGMPVVAAAADGEHELFAWVRSRSRAEGLCWVMGNEAHGVSLRMRAAADATVRIPMKGGAESLNVASAAAVCLYAALATGMED